jgi:hypothetical protein
MKIVIEREVGIGLYGFFGQIAQYREAPLHQIFLQAIIDQPGLTLSKMVKLFGLPAPACRQVLRPLESAGLLAPVALVADPALYASAGTEAEKSLPVDLLEGDWLALIADQPFYGQQLLGVMPASRFNFQPRVVRPEPAIESLKGQAFSAVGSYAYKQEGRTEGREVSEKGVFRQGMLTAVNLEVVATLDRLSGLVSHDTLGSTLTLRHDQPGLSLDLKLHSSEVRSDIESLGLMAIRRHNGRTGEKYGTEPVLRKTFAGMSNAEKQTGRGAIYEEMGELRVKIDDLRVLPADQPSYEAWVDYGFEQRLQGYAQAPQLLKHLQESIAFVDAQGFLKPKLPQVIERLSGKSKIYASALADWPDVSA